MFITFEGPEGCGKEQPIDCLVQTPTGPKRIGDLSIGDYVFGVDGEKTKVVGVFPQGVKQSYKITFRDGSSTECGIDHNWGVWSQKLRAMKKEPRVMTTRELIDSGLKDGRGNRKFSIPLCDPVNYPKTNLPIHPYILGVLIGDGYLCGNTPTLTIGDSDIEIFGNVEKFFDESHISIKRNKDIYPGCKKFSFVDTRHKINRFKEKIEILGLNVKSKEKFIPEIYKQSSLEQRFLLLRGLMDTDGSCSGNRPRYYTSSQKLCEDVVNLIQSLGGTAISRKYIRGDESNPEYSINVKMFESPFMVESKSNKWKLPKNQLPSRYISSIEKSRMVEQVCISVDSDKKLYLTDDYIVTHNTTQISMLEKWLISKGRVVKQTREPGGTGLGQHIRKIVKSNDPIDICPMADASLFNADRVQHINEVIMPALNIGAIVLCDRYFDSTMAYQHYGMGADPVLLKKLHALVCGGLMPQITFYLEIDPKIGLERAWGAVKSNDRSNTSTRFEEMDFSFHYRVLDGYRKIARENPNRVYVIDASLSIEEVFDSIKSHPTFTKYI